MAETNLIRPMVDTPETNRDTLLRQMFRQDLIKLKQQISESSAPQDWFETVLKLFEGGEAWESL